MTERVILHHTQTNTGDPGLALPHTWPGDLTFRLFTVTTGMIISHGPQVALLLRGNWLSKHRTEHAHMRSAVASRSRGNRHQGEKIWRAAECSRLPHPSPSRDGTPYFVVGVLELPVVYPAVQEAQHGVRH